jgi:hypothetical protein
MPDDIKEFIKTLSGLNISADEKDKTDIANPSIFNQIQKQRHTQRNIIFNFSLWVAGSSVSFVGGLIVIQAVIRIFCDSSFRILDNYQLEIISGGVILQVFGIISKITNALWNDKDYKDLLEKDYSNSKK